MAYGRVGVLGGMGPAATIDFLAKIIAATPAARDQEHVPTVVWNCPQIPDRSAAILSGDDSPFPPMVAALEGLQAAGADVLAIPCNTAHHWYDRLSAISRLPILHIVDAAQEHVLAQGRGPVALMATRGTIASGVYHRRWTGPRELTVPDSKSQALIDMAIQAVKAGAPSGNSAELAIERLLIQGAGTLLLACTELPIALKGSRFMGCCVDATQALAEACVAVSRGRSASVETALA